MRRLYPAFVAALLIIGLLATSFGLTYASIHNGGPPPGSSVPNGGGGGFYNCGGSCENKDPYQTGCINGAYIANSQSTDLVAVENWYSPNCGTNWNVTHLNGATDLIITIYRLDGSPAHCYPENCSSHYMGGLSPMWTNMVFAPNVMTEAHDHIYKPQVADVYVDA